MNNDNSVVKEFYITKLYGERNVRIKFDLPYKIIVAENGYGKTTILNCFYALLSGDISKLRKIDFEEVGVMFEDNIPITFTKKEFDIDLDIAKEHHFYSHIERDIGEESVIQLIYDTWNLPIEKLQSSNLYRKLANEISLPNGIIREFLRDVKQTSRDTHLGIETQERINTIKSKLGLKTLYLPTYRRVEEDIKAFGNEEIYKNSSINFGMRDVQESIDKITSEILSSSVEWFSKINGQMLSQLISGFSVTEEMKESISDSKAVQTVLERIGKNISEEHKSQILDLVETGKIQKDHKPLIYFVSNLLKVYEQQQENDEAIQNFTKVCNNYLSDKEIVYDESNVTISIVRKKNQSIVNIESLSSGEKQIISLFAMLYLQKKENLAIFFDEPELSLSMEWQKTLLPDIVKSGKCKFLFATTHSPFIFENDLQNNTVDLFDYIEEL